MNTVLITVKTRSDVKSKAQEIADSLGFTLSALINAYLRSLIKTKTVHFSLSEKPSSYLISSLKESAKNIKRKEVSPVFSDNKKAIKWLNHNNSDYEDTVQ